MKKKVRDKGIVLKISPYSESSQIVKVYCSRLGLISILAKGLRKSGALSPLVPLFEYEFNLYAPLEHGLYLYVDSSLIKETLLFDKPDCWAAAEAGIEVMSQILIPDEEAELYYELLRQYLDYLGKGGLKAIAVWWRFFRRILALSGYELRELGCEQCSCASAKITGLDLKTGNVLCRDCALEHPGDESLLCLSPLGIDLLAMLPEIGLHLDKIKLDRRLVTEMDSFLLAYFESRYHKTLKLKSLSVLEQFYPI